jgi:hypothetical protein
VAREQHIGASEDLFIGEDKTLPFEIYSSDESTIEDVTGWAMSWVLRKIGESNAVVITKTTGGGTITITGVFDADHTLNTQRVNVLLTDDDTDHLQPGTYEHALKRTTAGSETILSYGTVGTEESGPLMEPIFQLQIVYPDGSPLRFVAGSSFERDLIASCTAAILKRGVGFFVTEGSVAQAIGEGMREALLELKREARKVM